MQPDQFEERQLSPGFQRVLADHAKRVKLLQRHALLPAKWREWTIPVVANLNSRCTHTQRRQVEVEGIYGGWIIEVCAECGEIVSKECAHVKNTWHANGAVLMCGNCGIDGT